MTFDVVADDGSRGVCATAIGSPPRCRTTAPTSTPTFEGTRVEKITADEIEKWRDELVDERGLSRRTVNKLLINLGAILERAVKHHGLLRNPANDVPELRVRYDPTAFDFFSPDEVAALGAAAASDQDRAVYLTAAFTGLRMGS